MTQNLSSMAIFPKILVNLVLTNLVTNKNSNATSRNNINNNSSVSFHSPLFYTNNNHLFIDFRVLSNFAFSFSIISVLTGVTTLYNTGLNYGGPVSLVYGWLIASAFTMLVALSMAEICSSYPTSGGLYYWSAKLAGPNLAPFASWITGW
jgi:amino acid transporter